jgi:dihydroneopterin aldolase
VRDKIILAGMQFYARHGVFPEEKAMGQKFEIDVEIQLDLRPAGQTDDLKHTLNYADIYATIKNITTGRSFNLVEALAEEIAGEILENYPSEQVKVRVKKPHAPISGIFNHVGVEIIRGKYD